MEGARRGSGARVAGGRCGVLKGFGLEVAGGRVSWLVAGGPHLREVDFAGARRGKAAGGRRVWNVRGWSAGV